MLSKIAKLVIEIVPLKQSSKSVKELLARVSAPAARDSNPECIVETVIKERGPPLIEVEFTNKHKEKILTGEFTAQELVKRINETSQILEAEDVRKKAGMSNLRLEMGAGPESHKVGYARRIPIT